MVIIIITFHDLIKPAGLVRCAVAKFVLIQFGGWAVRTIGEAVGLSEPDRSKARSTSEAGHRSPQSQIGLWARYGYCVL